MENRLPKLDYESFGPMLRRSTCALAIAGLVTVVLRTNNKLKRHGHNDMSEQNRVAWAGLSLDGETLSSGVIYDGSHLNNHAA